MSQAGISSRLTVVDSLRGFSLAGIVIVHMLENYVGGPVPEGAMAQVNQGLADQAAEIFSLLFIRGKFFALFSFLFGLSFFIQMDSATKRSVNFSGRFAWRVFLLLIIGVCHHFFYAGDILTIYALLGFLLIPFIRVKDAWVLGLAALLLSGLPRFILFALGQGPGLLIEGLMVPNSALANSYFNTLQHGSLMDVFRQNGGFGHLMKMEFQLGTGSRAYLTFAFFLLGLYMGRLGYFRDFMAYRRQTRRALWLGLVVFILGLVVAGLAFSQLGEEGDFNSLQAMVGLTAWDISNLGMTAFLFSGFILLYSRKRNTTILDALAPYGRMALTNYVMQSIIGTFFFYGWGLGFIGTVRNSYVFLLALLIILLQALASAWWLKRCHYGPLEWAWRCLTHWKRMPLLRSY